MTTRPASHAHELEYVRPDELRPYENNPRVHTPRQVRQIANSIRNFGFAAPIIVDDANVVLAGHGRLQAAKLLGLDKVPVVRLSQMSEQQKRAYVIADNRIAELSGFDKSLLAIELQQLVVTDFDIEVTGFDTIEIDQILGAGDEAEQGEEVELPPETETPVSRPGDLWKVGAHRILCADARDLASYEQLLGEERAQMVFTDPPYNVPIDRNVSGLGAVRHREFAMASGEMSQAEFSQSFLRVVFRRIAAFAEPGAIIFACMDWRHQREILDAADGVFAELKNLIVWCKSNAGMGTFYRSQHELIFAFKASRGAHINNFGLGSGGRHRSNVWSYPGVNTFRKGRMKDLSSHPTVKPVKMVADAILDCSQLGDVIFDAFLGSGTTLVAAARTGRRGFGLEIDPLYVDVAVRRAEEATGTAAQLASGETFAEVRRTRSSEPQ